ncbi:MAG: AAA family ATPase [Candidatus Omnitrophota bacterium]
MAKKIFIAATLQNVGKTTFSLGLFACMQKIFKNIGFIKPIGQRYLMEQGYKVDEDSVLIEKVFDVCGGVNIKDLSPIAVEKGFTEKYIEGHFKGDYSRDIMRSYNKVAKNRDLVIIEGTGHAGVGSVFDLSNATVAKLLGARVILIAPGGVGRPIDEVMLNKAVFDRAGVKIAGVVVNKVLADKFNKINKYVRAGFKRLNVPVIGVMPYQRRLDLPTTREIAEELKVPLLCGHENLDQSVDKIVIGAMELRSCLRYVDNNTLVITPADRWDIIEGVIDVQRKHKSGHVNKISGVVFTGDTETDAGLMRKLEALRIPVLAIKTDTYTAAKRINNIVVKTKPADMEKIRLIVNMVERYVDFDMIRKNLT